MARKRVVSRTDRVTLSPLPAATAFEIMAVKGQAEAVFDLERRVLVRADVTTHVTLRDAQGNEARLPPWRHRLEVVEVVVHAVVTDRAGRPVLGLEPADFVVLEDGRRVRCWVAGP